MSKRILLLVFFPFLVVACSSIAIKHYQNPGNNQVADIPAVQVRFDRYVPPKIKDLRERTYYTRFLQGVNDLNGGDYNAALEKFSACARYFNDEGNALFMRAQCHVKLGSLTNALKDFYHAKQAGYEEDKTGPRIAQVLELLGHARLKEQSWAEALGYFKAAHVYGKENRYADNVLFCYFKLAEGRTGINRIITFFHAFNYIKEHKVSPSKNVQSLAGGLANALSESGGKEHILWGIPLLRYAIGSGPRDEGKANLHYSLGFLHASLGENELAKKHYGEVIKHYPKCKVYDSSVKQYRTLLRLVYAYHDERYFSVSSEEADISGLSLVFTVNIPQTVDAQKAGPPELFINGKKLAYTLKTDDFGTLFLHADTKGMIRKGTNSMVIKAAVEKTGRRVPVEKVKSFTLGDYDKNSRGYKLLTGAHDIVQVGNPVVQGMLVEIKAIVKTDNVFEITKAVYMYVMDKLTYKLYDNAKRPKNTIIDRLHRENYFGLCEDYAVLTAALLRGFGIPASCFGGPILNEKIGHAWTVFYLPDATAVTLDTTWGDNPNTRNYYLYYASNLSVAVQKVYNSNILKNGGSLSYISDGRLRVEMSTNVTRITLSE